MTFEHLLLPIQEWFSREFLLGLLSAILILFIGLFFTRRASQALSRISHLGAQQQLLVQKVSYYALATVVVAASLNQIGFDLKVLLGAAGILTVAVGFAAQTSASNLISGLFLILDRPFVTGDIIQVGTVRGEVLSIDLLSSKIRTFDNVLIRVPNETMVKSEIRNMTFFPVRRLDFKIRVSQKDDMGKARSRLLEIANRNPLCLEDPAPQVVFEGFSEAALHIQFSVWTIRQNMERVQNSILTEIKNTFDRAGVEIG